MSYNDITFDQDTLRSFSHDRDFDEEENWSVKLLEVKLKAWKVNYDTSKYRSKTDLHKIYLKFMEEALRVQANENSSIEDNTSRESNRLLGLNDRRTTSVSLPIGWLNDTPKLTKKCFDEILTDPKDLKTFKIWKSRVSSKMVSLQVCTVEAFKAFLDGSCPEDGTDGAVAYQKFNSWFQAFVMDHIGGEVLSSVCATTTTDGKKLYQAVVDLVEGKAGDEFKEDDLEAALENLKLKSHDSIGLASLISEAKDIRERLSALGEDMTERKLARKIQSAMSKIGYADKVSQQNEAYKGTELTVDAVEKSFNNHWKISPGPPEKLEWIRDKAKERPKPHQHSKGKRRDKKGVDEDAVADGDKSKHWETGKTYCKICHRTNHTTAECSYGSDVTCDECNRKGHIKPACFKKIGYPPKGAKLCNMSAGDATSDNGLWRLPGEGAKLFRLQDPIPHNIPPHMAMLDGGCDKHCTGKMALLNQQYLAQPRHMIAADGHRIQCAGIGQAKTAVKKEDNTFVTWDIPEVRHIPMMGNHTILSPGEMVDDYDVEFTLRSTDSFMKLKTGERIPICKVRQNWFLGLYPPICATEEYLRYQQHTDVADEEVAAVSQIPTEREPENAATKPLGVQGPIIRHYVKETVDSPTKLPTIDKETEVTQEQSEEELTLSEMTRTKVDTLIKEFLRYHETLGHMGFKKLQHYLRTRKSQRRRFPNQIVKRARCDHCYATKMLRKGKSSGPHEVRSNGPRTAIHLDVVEVKPPTTEGYKYFVPFIDEEVGDVFVYGLKTNPAPAVIAAARQYSIDIGGLEEAATFYVDRATQCKSKQWKQMNLEAGLTTKFSPPYCQWLNGVAERTIRDLFEKAKTMISSQHPKVPKNIWLFPLTHAARIRDILPYKDGPCPYERRTGKIPDPLLFPVPYGAEVYLKLPEGQVNKGEKMQPHTIPGYYLGTAMDSSSFTYIILVPDKNGNAANGTIRHTRDITLKLGSHDSLAPIAPPIESVNMDKIPEIIENEENDCTEVIDMDEPLPVINQEGHSSSVSQQPVPISKITNKKTKRGTVSVQFTDKNVKATTMPPVLDSSVDPTRKSARLQMKKVQVGPTPFIGTIAQHIHADGRLYVLGDNTDIPSAKDTFRLMFTQSSTEDDMEVSTMELLKDYLHPDDIVNTTSVGIGDRKFVPPGKAPAPTNPEDALKHPEFGPATLKEWNGFKEIGLYQEVNWEDIPYEIRKDQSALLKIITLWEWKKSGTAKARSIGLGNRYKKWLDDTFSPTSTLENLRLLLILEALKRKTLVAPEEQWKRVKFDVKQAFLNADLEEPVYAYPPPGFYPTGKNTMWLLKKALYGLCQSPRLWYKKFRSIINKLGFVTIENEPTLFVLIINDKLNVVLSINVDDSFVVGVASQVTWLLSELAKVLTITILEDGGVFLGLEFAIDNMGYVTLHQKKLITSMAQKFGLLDSYPTYKPIKGYLPLAKVHVPGLQLRSMVGASLYVGRGTHPELSFALGELSTHLHSHDDTHVDAAKYMIRYLIGVADYGITFKPNLNQQPMVLWADASWHGNKYDPKSRSRGGYCFNIYGVPIIWGSPLIRTPCLSSTDAEIYAMLIGLKRAYSMKKIMHSLLMFDKGMDEVIYIYCDSTPAKAVCDNIFATPRTKYLDCPLAWIRHLQELHRIKIVDIPSKDNLSDFMTKPFSKNPFLNSAKQLITKIPTSRAHG